MNAVRSSTGWSRRPLGEDWHAGATRSRVFRSGQAPARICSNVARAYSERRAVAESGGQWCLGTSWARILSSSTVTPRPERDVEVAVAQGGVPGRPPAGRRAAGRAA